MKVRKVHFSDFSEETPGPYYDPTDSHIHIWKNTALIKNFVYEQDPHKEYYCMKNIPIVKNGEYCCICHTRKTGRVSTPKVNKNVEPIVASKLDYTKSIKEEINQSEIIKPSIKQKTKINKNNDRIILYKLNELETIFLEESKMTSYQKFRHNNMDYKKTCSFIINSNETFKTNYYMIVNINF